VRRKKVVVFIAEKSLRGAWRGEYQEDSGILGILGLNREIEQ
jgi:hypothetical protein